MHAVTSSWTWHFSFRGCSPTIWHTSEYFHSNLVRKSPGKSKYSKHVYTFLLKYPFKSCRQCLVYYLFHLFIQCRLPVFAISVLNSFVSKNSYMGWKDFTSTALIAEVSCCNCWCQCGLITCGSHESSFTSGSSSAVVTSSRSGGGKYKSLIPF